MENNIQLIQRCRDVLKREDEPHISEWIDMVEDLCAALEKRERDWDAMMSAATPHGAVWEKVEGS